MNKSLLFSTVSRNRELTRLNQTTPEVKIELILNFIRINPHPTPTWTQNKHRTFHSPFVVTKSKFTPADGPPIDHQWGNITLQRHLWFETKNSFLKPMI